MPRVRSEVRARRPAVPRRALPVQPQRHVARAAGPPSSWSLAGARLAFTTRAALLGLAVCAVVLTLAYPARQYLAQRAKIAALAHQERTDERAVQALWQTIAQGQAPSHIISEARQRLQLKMPGDQVFYLPAAPAGTPVTRHDGVQTPVVAGHDHLPWYDEAWKSTVAASH